MFVKPFDDIDLEDIENLIRNKQRENIHLDYKAELTNSGTHKKRLAKDISAFANTDGGYLIIGVREQGGEPKEICGTPALIGRQKVEEWIENVVLWNTSKRIDVNIKVLPLPQKAGKVVVLMYASRSRRMPHMLTYRGENTYYKRHETQVLRATESEVREMFEASSRGAKLVEGFLRERNIIDDTAEYFAKNHYSSQLATPIVAKQKKGGVKNPRSPFVIYAVCPSWLDEKVNIAADDFWAWLDLNSLGYEPGPRIHIVPYRKEITLDSLVCVEWRQIDEHTRYATNYLEMHRNGYLEIGLCRDLIWSADAEGVRLLLHLTHLVGSFWVFLSFATAFYDHIRYFGELEVYMCLADVKDLVLHGFGRKNANETWVEPHSALTDFSDHPSCTSRNVKIQSAVLASQLSDERSKEVVRYFADRVSNAFGNKQVKCFDDAGAFNVEGFRYFRRS